MKTIRLSLLPAAVAFAAMFLVLPSSGAQATVHIVRAGSGWAFNPPIQSVRAGQRVAFVNNTRQTHTASCDRCAWDTGDIQPGQTKFVTIEAPSGADAYHCKYHGQAGMTGQIKIA